VDPRQASIQEAFDRHATHYDERFSNQVLGERIRAEVWQITDQAFASARRVLDLGSGTGEDAIHLARKGVHVTAVDISSRMISRLNAKASVSGVSGNIDPVVSEMDHYSPPAPEFDGILSNFGAINCLPDLIWLRELAQRGLKPGSRLVLTTMGRFYPLETAVLFLKGQFRRAFRRFQTPCEVTIEGLRVAVYYHSLKAMRKMLGSDFHLESVTGLRAFLPVPGWEHLGSSGSFRLLAPMDRIWCRLHVTAPHADHFVTVWRYEP
jgi:ubiquinone/menaquinone biosynthesis C-methylase UbiE